MATRAKKKTPWERGDPKPPAARRKLSPAQKTAAKARAKRAGRPYPNMTDNMAVARKAARKSGPKKTARDRLRDPRGGLTSAGRAHFRRTEGARLKPGITKPEAAMTPAEMKRKGSWAARFYGRETLPPLRDADGEPTRFALTAAAWGEPVPRTVAAARRIAAKGRRLLERARRAAAR